MSFQFDQHPHRRYNPLTREWILVSPHRALRPWQGQVERPAQEDRPTYDPTCYLCPGNVRANGQQNPAYTSTFVFDNDFPALLPDSPGGEYNPHPLIRAEGERGTARVVCFTPRHDLTLAEMATGTIRQVVEAWVEQYQELAQKPYIAYVQIFENRGAMMGASNPHPHGQIWATEHIPDEPAIETESLKAYAAEKQSCLLCDYLQVEQKEQIRLVCENEDFLVVVPWWAVWPFETLVLAKRHVGALPEFSDREKTSLADILQQITTRYDNLFETSFPYT